MPHDLQRYNLLQSHHLLPLQDMLTEVLYQSHLDDTSAFEACLKLFPDFLLHHKDEYMAVLIGEICRQRPELKTIFIVCGYG